MRVAIIDLGTNSVRFDVHEISSDSFGPPDTLHREKLMVRLGQGVFLEGRLNRDAVRRTIEAFKSFHETARTLKASKTIAFGTSALREARDGKKFISILKKKTGIDLEIISGAHEARLIALGVLNHEPALKGSYGLIDIGGGSTEISICRGKKVLASDSFPLGTARLQQVFLRQSPPAKGRNGDLSAIQLLRRSVKSVLLPKILSEEWPKVDRVLGSSGTIKALAKLIKERGKLGPKGFAKSDLKKLIKKMSDMNTTELLALPGMESKRADMILSGALLLDECLEATGAKWVQPTDYSLRDGILEEQIELVNSQRKTAKKTQWAAVLTELSRLAKTVGVPKEKIESAPLVAGRFFDHLARYLKIPVAYRPILQVAALFSDVGSKISPLQRDAHSAYWIGNLDLPELRASDLELLSELCLRQRSGLRAFSYEPDFADFPNGDEINKVFPKLLALHRMVVALEECGGKFHFEKVLSRRSEIEVQFKAPPAANMEITLLRLDQRKDLFEDLTGKGLQFTRLKSTAPASS